MENSTPLSPILYAKVLSSGGGGGSGLTEDVKQAFLNAFNHVAWTDEHGQDYVDALEAALYPIDHITAAYTQSGTVYNTDSLDSLRDDLVVTAHYQGGDSKTVTTYTLSGTLTPGTSTITVSYGGKTATFDVVVTESKTWLYHFNDSLASSGTKDFGLTAGTPNYMTGKFGKALSVVSGTKANIPYAIGITAANLPTFAGDFTISWWQKTYNDFAYHTVFRLCKYLSADRIENSALAVLTNYNGHTPAANVTLGKGYAGISSTQWNKGTPFVPLFTSENEGYAFTFDETNAVNQLADTLWHHIAVCRKDGIATLYVDGQKWQSFPLSGALYVPDQILFGGSWDATNTAAGITAPQNANVDEFYINDGKALYDGDFTPPSAPY